MPRPPGLPIGMRVELDPETKFHDDGSLYGGSPPRLMRFTATGRDALTELRAGTVVSAAGSALARRLTDAGVMHPRPGTADAFAGQVTVIIPVRDRAEELGRCLSALLSTESPSVAEVIVVDDASFDPGSVALVAAKYGARLIRRPANGGPGAARNTGLEHATTPFIAFCDSDCVPSDPWIDALLGHFRDPLVAAVAPRMVTASESVSDSAVEPASFAVRFAQARSALDLGALPARVAPLTRVSYVPTAAIIVRRSAIDGLATPRFDPALRYGEDVDLVWRLIDAGWRIRYDPSAEVAHVDVRSWKALLARRFAYGTSAAALNERHPGQVTPLILVASPAMTVAALIARRPYLAAAAFVAGYADIALTLRRAGRPFGGIDGFNKITGPLARSVLETFTGCGRWTTQFAIPAAALALALPARNRAARVTRAAAVTTLVTVAPAREWLRTRPSIGAPSWVAAVLADEVSYGAGVWTGAIRTGSLRPVTPQWRWHLMTAPARDHANSPGPPVPPGPG